MAQIMFFNGMSRTATNGNIKYLKNPNNQTNLAFSLQLQAQAALKYPGFTRKIYVKGYRYNLHYRGCLLYTSVQATVPSEDMMGAVTEMEHRRNMLLVACITVSYTHLDVWS